MSTTVWFVKHQSGGIMSEHPFAKKPTQEQVDAVVAEAEYKFGGRQSFHADGDWWGATVVEVAVHDDETPVYTPPSATNSEPGAVIGLSVVVGGVGHVGE